VKAKDTIIMDIFRELSRELPLRKKKATLYVSPSISERIKEDPAPLENLEKKYGKKIIIKPVERFHQERYEIL